MRTYKPTYSPRYKPRPAGEPAVAQASLCAMPDLTPPVCPASVLYEREATSMTAIRTDSRISGPCRITEFDGSDIPSRVIVVPPKSPYYRAGPNEEQEALILAATGQYPARNVADMYNGCQMGGTSSRRSGNWSPTGPMRHVDSTDAGVSAGLAETGILSGYSDETAQRGVDRAGRS